MAADSGQLRHVGNLGDIFKHAALVATLDALRGISGRLLYVESNAFRPVAPLKNKAWWQEVKSLPQTEAVRRYREFEEPYVSKDLYLCSPGIATELLKKRAPGSTDILLCERAKGSLALLRAAIPQAALLNNHGKLATELLARAGGYSAVVALIDPYKFRDVAAHFRSWLLALSGAVQTASPTAVLVFDHGSSNPSWCNQDEPLELTGGIDESPYHLAFYASRAGKDLVWPSLKTGGMRSANERAGVSKVR